MLLLSSFNLFNQLIGNFPINSCLIIVSFILLSHLSSQGSWTFQVKVVSFHILLFWKIILFLTIMSAYLHVHRFILPRHSSYNVYILSLCSDEQNLGIDIQFRMILEIFTNMPQMLTWIMCVTKYIPPISPPRFTKVWVWSLTSKFSSAPTWQFKAVTVK